MCVGSPHEREYQQQGMGVALPRPTLGIMAKDAEGKEEVRVRHTGSAIALTGTDNNAPAIYSIFIAITLSVCTSSLSLSLSLPNKTSLGFRVKGFRVFMTRRNPASPPPLSPSTRPKRNRQRNKLQIPSKPRRTTHSLPQTECQQLLAYEPSAQVENNLGLRTMLLLAYSFGIQVSVAFLGEYQFWK